MKQLTLKFNTTGYFQNYNNYLLYALCNKLEDKYESLMKPTYCKDYFQDIMWYKATGLKFSQYGLSNHDFTSPTGEMYHMCIFYNQVNETAIKEHKELLGSSSNILTLINYFSNLYNFLPSTIEHVSISNPKVKGYDKIKEEAVMISFDAKWFNSAPLMSFFNILIKVGYLFTGKGNKTNIKAFLTTKLNKFHCNEQQYLLSSKEVIISFINGFLPCDTTWGLDKTSLNIHNNGLVRYAKSIGTDTPIEQFKEFIKSYTEWKEQKVLTMV